jgi:hypothetical protein
LRGATTPRLPTDRCGLAKIVTPGLRIGFCVAPAPLLARLAEERATADRHGSTVIEATVAELLDDGEIQRHARRTRRIYHARRDALAAALRIASGARSPSRCLRAGSRCGRASPPASMSSAGANVPPAPASW